MLAAAGAAAASAGAAAASQHAAHTPLPSPAPLQRARTVMTRRPATCTSSSSGGGARLERSSSRVRRVAAAGADGSSGAVDLSAFGLEVPTIDATDTASYQAELGAEFDAASGVAQTFNNTQRVLDALADGAVLVDRSHWGRLRVGGGDRLDLLHNQSTADFKSLQPGQGCDTVFVTATARCLDLATALVLDGGVLLLVSPSMTDALLQRLQGVIFPADDVTVSDVSDACRMFTLLGPQADDVLKELAGDAFALENGIYGSHQKLAFGGDGPPLIVAVTSGLAVPGYTFVVDAGRAADLYAVLINKGCVPMGQADWERLRITQGRPAPGAELTDAYNPLEAGLAHAVSLQKGCYIGQETLAKVTAANGVKQQLWGLQLSGRALPGARVTALPAAGDSSSSSSSSSSSGAAPEALGVLTSYANLEASGHFGLAYLKCRKGGAQVALEGLTVAVDGAPAKVVPLPYATRSLPRTAAQAAAAAAGDDSAGGPDSLADRAAAAKRRQPRRRRRQQPQRKPGWRRCRRGWRRGRNSSSSRRVSRSRRQQQSGSAGASPAQPPRWVIGGGINKSSEAACHHRFNDDGKKF